MRLSTFTITPFKRYLFTLGIFTLTTLFAEPAFSQVDYYYGINKTGFRVSLGGGGSRLASNWGKSPYGTTATMNVDYDFNQFISIGLAGSYGHVTGKDTKIANGRAVLVPGSTYVNFGGGDLNLKVAVGAYTKFTPRNIWGDMLKRFYVGVGVGEVHSNVTLSPHNLVPPYTPAGTNASNKYLESHMKTDIEDVHNQTTGSGNFVYIPITAGTYISLRKFTKKDKFELNPNFQYAFVQSPLFDGYQPATRKIGSIDANGNQGFMLLTLSLRYKF